MWKVESVESATPQFKGGRVFIAWIGRVHYSEVEAEMMRQLT